jgi:hypothetical protein
MTAASSKSRPRKSMRVATIFTGVAAATIGMTQVAQAQETAHPAARPTPRNNGRFVRPAERVSGSIRQDSDCANRGIDKNWLHVSTNTSFSENPYQSICFGFRGMSVSPPYIGINAECGGNNHGYLAGLAANGRSWFSSFGPGTTYRKLVEPHLNEVYIRSWTGTDACGKPPNWFD